MAITILRNLAAYQALRRLTESTKKLSESEERLSSGLRINGASDDAAGLAISTSLQVDSRVYFQGVRNLNDGISLLNIADGSLVSLQDITFRLQELAAQSANGVLTAAQRLSIDVEGQALVGEYNRIIAVTQYNGLKLLDGSLGSLTLQAGYGTEGSLTISIGQSLQRNLGTSSSVATADGTFQPGTTYAAGAASGTRGVDLGDLNNDGKLDIVSIDQTLGRLRVYLGNGNGTFGNQVSYATGSTPRSLVLGDFNSDGKLDVALTASNNDKIEVRLGNGDSSFQARISYATNSTPYQVVVSDFNGDGKLDLIDSSSISRYGVHLGNGNGSFKAIITYAIGGVGRSLAVADFNGDGIDDLVVGDTKIFVSIGNGNGSFKASTSFATFLTSGPGRTATGDVNGDGKQDVVFADSTLSKLHVFFGNGDGSLQAPTSYDAPIGARAAGLRDLNGDGFLDIASGTASANNQGLSLLFNNGNGTFKSRITSAADYIGFITFGDLNGDNITDIATATYGVNGVQAILGNGTAATTGISFLTQTSARAAITTLAGIQTSIANERANIGAHLSRVATAVSNLQQSRENFDAAASRITDVDVAQETAELARTQILQEASSAVLGQANQQPALVLKLLKGK